MASLPSTLKSQESEACKSRMCSGSGPASGKPAGGGCVGLGGASTRTVVRPEPGDIRRVWGDSKGARKGAGLSFMLRRAGGAHSRWCDRNREGVVGNWGALVRSRPCRAGLRR